MKTKEEKRAREVQVGDVLIFLPLGKTYTVAWIGEGQPGWPGYVGEGIIHMALDETERPTWRAFLNVIDFKENPGWDLLPARLTVAKACDCGGLKARTTHSHWCSSTS